MTFSKEQLERYSRHIILNGVGLQGQKKLLLGDLLVDRMLIFDGLTMKFREVQFPNLNPLCRVCGENADINEVKKDNYVSRYSCKS